MKTYRTRTPRTTLALAAVALTALTFGAGVVLPVATGPSERVLQIASTAAPGAQPLRHLEPIEVIAYRERSVSSAIESGMPRKPQG